MPNSCGTMASYGQGILIIIISLICFSCANTIHPHPSLIAHRAHLESSKSRIQDLLQTIHHHQHPPKSKCRTRRLLLTQFSSSFEGIGSVTKAISSALAEAIHSNRTLVWGLDLPYTFNHTRELWGPNSIVDSESIEIDGVELRCTEWRGYGGGPFSCFFQNLSSCSVEDIPMEELLQLGRSAHDDASRLRLMEARRSPGMYFFPRGIPGFQEFFKITYKGNEAALSLQRHEWAAAIAAYVFRLKPEVEETFENRRKLAWPVEAGGNAGHCACGQRKSTDERTTTTMDEIDTDREVWGFHVRHGDNKAMPDLYGNKRWYPLIDYVEAARQRAWKYADVSNDSSLADDNVKYATPRAIFITSDGFEISKEVEDACKPKELAKWPGGTSHAPCIFVSEPSKRFRTPHGSHTAAADGGCSKVKGGKLCSLYADAILYYTSTQDQSPGARAMRILRTMLEGVEDIYTLSYSQVFAGTGTSQFSVMGLFLSWARYGVWPGGESVIIMDEGPLEEGLLQNGFLHGKVNGTGEIQRGQGYKRWTGLTRCFIEGVEPTASYLGAFYEPTEKERGWLLRMQDHIPYLPEAVFRAEARRWTGKKGSQSVWPKECPLPLPDGFSDVDVRLNYTQSLMDLAIIHQNIHPNQARRCWSEATKVLVELITSSNQTSLTPEVVGGIVERLKNIESYMQESATYNSKPYSEGEEVMKELLQQNVLGEQASLPNRSVMDEL